MTKLDTHTRRTRLSRFKASQEWVEFRGEPVQVVMYDAQAFTVRRKDGSKIHVTRNSVYDHHAGSIQ
jgi:hypothetical protein